MRPWARVEPYDDTFTSGRIIAVGDLYYFYQHERIGDFPVVQDLQEPLGVPVDPTGFVLHDDAPHAPTNNRTRRRFIDRSRHMRLVLRRARLRSVGQFG